MTLKYTRRFPKDFTLQIYKIGIITEEIHEKDHFCLTLDDLNEGISRLARESVSSSNRSADGLKCPWRTTPYKVACCL